MDETVPFHRKAFARPLLWTAVFLACLGTIGALIAHFAAQNRRQSQMQTDPEVATAWIVGVTQGANKTLVRGSHLQRWLNEQNVHLLGDYRELRTRYTADADGVEFWFDYDSHILGHPLLECHRVDRTAFVDDLGQPYHGFLEFQGKSVGVYLPGYDHAAHRLTCTLHWMPRRPDLPMPVSLPMAFIFNLPPARRVLPVFDALPRGPVSQTTGGVTITAEAARLGPPLLATLNVGQRNLTFRLKVRGGHLANPNVFRSSPVSRSISPFYFRSVDPRVPLSLRGGPFGSAGVFRSRPQFSGSFLTVNRPLEITDPYGISLISPGEMLSPLSADDASRESGEDGTTWAIAVNGGGRGTDAIRLQCDVLPTGATSPNAAIHFDLILPVQTGDEI